MKINYLFSLLVIITLNACQSKSGSDSIGILAEEYVKICLTIGQYDTDFVDAYYGPDNLKPTAVADSIFPKQEFLSQLRSLKEQINASDVSNEEQARKEYLMAQIIAAEERVRIFSGETTDFDSESQMLFGVKAPHYEFAHYDSLINELSMILPGKGTVNERFQSLGQQFVIPLNKIDTLFKTAIQMAREESKKHFELPSEENFTINYVSDKPWSGYNWYQGNYQSKIQINTDFPIAIERVLDVGSHESYPGHHVYNMLLEKNLYKDKGYIETSLYPLFSPQSFIAEGSANYGIEMVFPYSKKLPFTSLNLLPLAGLDTTGIGLYFQALKIAEQLNYINNEVARGLFANKITDDEAKAMLVKYGLYSSEKAIQRLSFIKKYRSYVINYNFGKDLIKNAIEGTEDHWRSFGYLLSHQILPIELTKKKPQFLGASR